MDGVRVFQCLYSRSLRTGLLFLIVRKSCSHHIPLVLPDARREDSGLGVAECRVSLLTFSSIPQEILFLLEVVSVLNVIDYVKPK